MAWCEVPNIALLWGNLGNTLCQLFAAQAVIDRLGTGTISNLDLRDWGIYYSSKTQEDYRNIYIVDSADDLNFSTINRLVNNDPSLYIANRYHLQRQDLFGSRATCSSLIPPPGTAIRRCTDQELLINIRTGDILTGAHPHYPLTPVEFYEDIVNKTGLIPVFMGQIESSSYIDKLRSVFPNAEYIPSQGTLADFDMVRSATHIVPAVSTFSLMAAWLSSAKTIYLTLNGFLNPAQFRDIDLLPVDDARYRFFLFPVNYALPEIAALKHHEKMSGHWKEISKSRLSILKNSPPAVPEHRWRSPGAIASVVDERFYVHEYVDAAMDISEGWYESGLHHYLDIGRSLGYRMTAFTQEVATIPNVALGKTASQSSLSPWSLGDTIESDAAQAVDGDVSKQNGFHTNLDHSPWWKVDCGQAFLLKKVCIYNRKGDIVLQERASPLLVECSINDKEWIQVRRTQPGEVFGDGDNASIPLTCFSNHQLVTRYIRISIPSTTTYLHLCQVEVYGIII